MKIRVLMLTLLTVIIAAVAIGCSANWQTESLNTYATDADQPDADVCKECHSDEHDAWEQNLHSDV